MILYYILNFKIFFLNNHKKKKPTKEPDFHIVKHETNWKPSNPPK